MVVCGLAAVLLLVAVSPHLEGESDLATTLHFPDYVDGEGWSVQLALSNVDPTAAAAVVVTAYDQEGQPGPELFDSEVTFEIPSRGSRVLRSAGAGSIRRGWIQVQSDTASVSGLLTYRHAGTGVEVSVEPVELGSHFALFVEESGGIGTGLAIFKPDPSSGIEFRIYDEDGINPLGEGVARVGNFSQAARTIPEWFAMDGIDTEFFLKDFQGLLYLRAADGSSFAPLGLRFGKRGESLSAVPVIQILDARPPNLDPPEGLLYFPDYVDGGGWSVQLALSNVDPTAAVAVVVTAYDQEGQPGPELFDSEATFEIPSRGSRVLRSAGAGSIRRGWIQVQSQAASVRGLLTYRHGKTGIEVGVEPVPLRDHFALFVEESTDIGTGLAIFKPDAAPEIEFQIRNQAGLDPIGEVLSWGNFQQRAQTIPEWFERVNPEILKDFQGLLYLRAADGSSFAPLGLRFGKRRGSLSAVPVIPILDARPPTVSLSASPASIEWGRSATLRWSSTGAVSATLTPGIGAVPTSGSHSVSPTRTTTYRVTV